MSEALVRGIRINYEIIGSRGPFIALTPGSRRPYGELVALSRRLAEHGYRVLLHDRRNCGSSEVAIEGIGSEHEIWADDLHELLRQLGGLPAYVGGSSAGARLAILFALRHPTATRGLLLWRVTGGKHATEKLAEQYYGSFMKLAESGGMEAVCASEHFAECIAARPGNRERLMGMDKAEFIRVMGLWRDSFIQASNLPIIGATEAQLRSMTAPLCAIAGNDKVHPPTAARKVKALVPNAELHDDVVEKRADDNLKDEWDKKEWAAAEPRIVEIFADFLRRAEALQQAQSVA
jgi:pimeloyl-ACP methyl ester carboxylesterase